ncbi:MAG: hypothetical protein Q9180_001841 [Flavoplaca navasiana]
MADLLQQDWEGQSTPSPSQVPMNAATQDFPTTQPNTYFPPSDIAMMGSPTPMADLLQQGWPLSPLGPKTSTTADLQHNRNAYPMHDSSLRSRITTSFRRQWKVTVIPRHSETKTLRLSNFRDTASDSVFSNQNRSKRACVRAEELEKRGDHSRGLQADTNFLRRLQSHQSPPGGVDQGPPGIQSRTTPPPIFSPQHGEAQHNKS